MGNVAVYKKGTTNFFSQGLGLLSDVVSSTLTQTVSSTGNVEQKLEVEYPIDGYLVSELVEGAILRVSVSTDKSDYGVFEIVDTLKDDSGTITVYGDPYYNRILRMSFDNGGVFTKFSNVQSALNVAKQNITGFPADFNLTSNLSTSVDLSENTYDTFGTFLEALNSAVHGNIKYSLNSIQIYSAIGKDITDITLRDDMNTSSVKITTDFSGIINKVIPVLPVLDKDGNATDQTKVGTIVTSKYSNQFLDYWAGKVIQFDTQDLANTYFDRTNADRPVHTVDVNPIGLDDDFSTINIFDTIELYSTRLDYTDKLRVSERVFDTLSENVTSFKLGSSSVNIFNQINEQNNEIFNNVVKLTNAAISANGKGIDYFGQAKPSSPKEGDTWFWDDGTDFGIKQYTNGEWVDLAGSNTAEKIATAVTDAVTQAKAYSDQLVADNASQINTVLDDVQAKQADLTAQQAELDTKAQGYANKALADAKANTLATATQTAKDASDALATAKTDLTTSLNKEVTDRANAVTALDTKAKGYADTAKNDAISASTTADGIINKKIDDTTSSITSTISQNKTDADGKITTAQSTATQALNGLATKVSQTVYDAKTGQLQTDLNTTTTTANQAKTDIVAIKSDNTKQDARMTTIESDANGTKTTVSNLQTDLGKANGSISTLQQRADGFDATVTKVDNLSVGGRNLLLGTATPWTVKANDSDWNFNSIYDHLKGGTTYTFSAEISVSNGQDSVSVGAFDASIGTRWAFSANFSKGVKRGSFTFTTPDRIDNDGHFIIYAGTVEHTAWLSATYTHMKLEEGNVPTAWTPAPEDLSSATAQAQLTADNATLSINNYKTDADGRISKAQADIIVNANAITQKVSQSDYNTKTGDLTTKVNTAQSTADSATSTIGAYKTSNDARVSSAESKITANTNAITQKVSQTDYNAKTGELSGQISQVSQTADKISQSVSDVKTQVDGLSVGGRNYVLDSNISITGSSTQKSDLKSSVPTSKFSNQSLVVSVQVDYDNITAISDIKRLGFEIQLRTTNGQDVWKGAWKYPQLGENFHGRIHNVYPNIGEQYIDNIGNTLIEGIYIQGVEGTGVKLSNPKLEIGTFATDYIPAPEDTDNKISTVSQTVDSISSIVSDPTTGLTKRVQTAEGSVSTVQSNVSDLQSKQTQTANGLTTEISNRATGDTNTLTQSKDFTTSSISNSESGMKSLITQTSDAILGKVGAVNLFPNSEFEKDYGYRTKNPCVTLSLDTKNLINTQYNGTVTVKATNAGWQGYWARNIEVQGGQKYSGSVLVHYTNGGVTGGYATLDRWFVDKDGNRISGGIGGSGQGTTGEVTSPYWVKLYFEGVTAPDNAVNLQVSLLTNDKGVGQTALFTQPMVTATEKLQPYTPNNDITTQLALLKDNWSIGIADNAGAITNGIVGNSTNMSLISNNVVINAPSTQIKGTAWINSAMIANGAIGTAQIGDAAITSAKIANLDVSKITGNVTNFIQSNWNGVFASTMIDNTGMSINGGNTTTKFDTTGAHYSNSSGINATYSFGKWSDSNSNATSATGLYIGATGSSNAFINILSTNGAAALVLAGTAMDFGSNLNVLQGALNAYVNVNIRERLMFKANRYVGGQPSYIEVDEINRTFNFFTGGGSGTNKDYFYFNQNVISAGTFSSTSVLSKKNVKSVYDEDALGEIAKTQLVNFEYKNRIGQNHVSPIIDDVNSEKEYYIPKTILGQDNEYVDMYSMISMAWKAIQQLNEKIGDK